MLKEGPNEKQNTFTNKNPKNVLGMLTLLIEMIDFSTFQDTVYFSGKIL